jgi:hypothetical protein
LKTLEMKARQLKTGRQAQLGELVLASGADALTAEEPAGALLAGGTTTDRATKEAWRKRGAAFFSSKRQKLGNRATNEPASAAARASSTPPLGSEPRPGMTRASGW